MAIKVTKQHDVHVSERELRSYQEEYRRFCMGYCGAPPSLEDFIRSQQKLRDAVAENFKK